MKLHEQRDALQATIDRAVQELSDLIGYLQSEKFQGVDNNFVNAREMQNRIIAINMILQSRD